MQTAVRIHTEVFWVMTTLSVMNSLPYGRCRQYVHKDLQKSTGATTYKITIFHYGWGRGGSSAPMLQYMASSQCTNDVL